MGKNLTYLTNKDLRIEIYTFIKLISNKNKFLELLQ
jgi:hypothetical protein